MIHFNTYKYLHIYSKYDKNWLKKHIDLNYIYKPMVIYNAIVFVKFIFNELKEFPKDKLLMLYILLMHITKYYVYVNWNILIEVWNIRY